MNIRTNKPWGYEMVWAHTPWYIAKIMYIKKGEETSVHYHNLRHENVLIMEGEMELLHNGKLKIMKPGDTVHIIPEDHHRFVAITDVKLMEVSTQHTNDECRLEDRYGRV